MSGEQWYVKVKQQVKGPLTTQKLESLFNSGVVPKTAQVSKDRVTWRAWAEWQDAESQGGNPATSPGARRVARQFVNPSVPATALRTGSKGHSRAGQQVWYTHFGDAAQGPYEFSMIQRMAASGKLSATDWIYDGTDWVTAGEVPGLEFARQGTVALSMPQQPASVSMSVPSQWPVSASIPPWLGWTAFGGLVLLVVLGSAFGWEVMVRLLLWAVVLGLGLVALLCGAVALDAKTSDEKRLPGIVCGCSAFLALVVWSIIPDSASPESAQPASTAGDATYSYWLQVRTINRKEVSPQAIRSVADLQNAQGISSGMAWELSKLPIANVDPDVVAHVAAMVTYLNGFTAWTQETGQLIRDAEAFQAQTNSPEVLVEVVMRSFTDDPFGKAREVFSERQQLLMRQQEIQKRQGLLEQSYKGLKVEELNLRSSLNQKYARDFPALGK